MGRTNCLVLEDFIMVVLIMALSRLLNHLVIMMPRILRQEPLEAG
ncbi:MAG: hypothetical protein H6Q75_1643 [Firmicutes bacterium]|nr:hypothetical protein [Bacillota bacterium]